MVGFGVWSRWSCWARGAPHTRYGGGGSLQICSRAVRRERRATAAVWLRDWVTSGANSGQTTGSARELESRCRATLEMDEVSSLLACRNSLCDVSIPVMLAPLYTANATEPTGQSRAAQPWQESAIVCSDTTRDLASSFGTWTCMRMVQAVHMGHGRRGESAVRFCGYDRESLVLTMAETIMTLAMMLSSTNLVFTTIT
uniref:Uncharacterized protein n=1 Tax=Leersia perrieri TaxID=77586 RepID=A0A0D9VQS3_9ORYZ